MGLVAEKKPDSEAETEVASEEGTEPETETEGETAEKLLEVSFLDVGQGDATLAVCGENAILIDTGSSTAELDILAYMKEQGVEKLDYLVLSHGHEDHMGKACDILEAMPVEHVICDFGNQEGYVQRLEGLLDEKEADVIEPEGGEEFAFGDATLHILMGREKEIEQTEIETTNVNNQSIMAAITFGEHRFLFYGDGEVQYEQYALTKNLDLKADVVKVAHHGGNTSGTELFMNEVEPDYAVISSAAKEEFGFPTDEALYQLGIRQITTFTTNKKGTVKALSDGKTLSWTCER